MNEYSTGYHMFDTTNSVSISSKTVPPTRPLYGTFTTLEVNMGSSVHWSIDSSADGGSRLVMYLDNEEVVKEIMAVANALIQKRKGG